MPTRLKLKSPLPPGAPGSLSAGRPALNVAAEVAKKSHTILGSSYVTLPALLCLQDKKLPTRTAESGKI
jgi:hypothetical protein